MSLAGTDVVASTRSPDRLSAIPVTRSPRDSRGLSPRSGDRGLTAFPLAGQPGHGCTASLRRQAAPIVTGLAEGSRTEAFELICYECGDHSYLDYSEISHRLQRIRGPYTMRAGLAAYENHIELTT